MPPIPKLRPFKQAFLVHVHGLVLRGNGAILFAGASPCHHAIKYVTTNIPPRYYRRHPTRPSFSIPNSSPPPRRLRVFESWCHRPENLRNLRQSIKKPKPNL